MMRFVLKSKSLFILPSILPPHLSSQRREAPIYPSPVLAPRPRQGHCHPRSRFPYSRKVEKKHKMPPPPPLPCRHFHPGPNQKSRHPCIARSLARLGLQHSVLHVAGFRIRLGAVVLRKKRGWRKQTQQQQPKDRKGAVELRKILPGDQHGRYVCRAGG